MLDKTMLAQLRQPFPAELIQWKPGATNRDKSKALGLAYVDPRHYQDRLDEVLGPNWSDDYEVYQDGGVILCRLTLAGTTRTDVGEKESADKNTATSAKAQAFKRACTAFGLGRYLYEFPQLWVTYNSQYRKFTDEGKAQLSALAQRHSASLGKAPKQPSGVPDYESVAGQDAEPDPKPQKQSGNGKRNIGATVKTGKWAPASVALAESVPYYQKKGGAPDGYHMTGAAKKCGHAEITDANLDDVITDLTEYAQVQQALDEEETQQPQDKEQPGLPF